VRECMRVEWLSIFHAEMIGNGDTYLSQSHSVCAIGASSVVNSNPQNANVNSVPGKFEG